VYDGRQYEIVPASSLHFETYPSREAALNAYIASLIEERNIINAVIKSAQKKQRRWDARTERRGC
jgi:hypothetical protein